MLSRTYSMRAPLWRLIRNTYKSKENLENSSQFDIKFSMSSTLSSAEQITFLKNNEMKAVQVAPPLSQRMKEFHEKLKLQPEPRVRFNDLVSVETDPISGDLRSNTEKDPTKWGDWQVGGRVSDF